MMVIRPVEGKDLNEIYTLAFDASDGITTLPVSKERLAERIQSSQKAFSATVKGDPGSYYYFLVLEDTDKGRIVGTTGIFSQVGMTRPFYNYEIREEKHSCSDPEVETVFHSLHYGTPYKGSAELATLYLYPDYRHSGNGTLLSKSRLLLVAAYPERFADNIMAEIRGWVDDNNQSPFWDAVGRNFFKMELVSADRINSFGNYRFIEDLMPRHPLYVELLPDAAQAVIGVTHEESKGARRILESEGLKYTGKVDVFDGGPCIDADRKDIRAIAESKTAKIEFAAPKDCHGRFLVANPGLEQFRVVQTPIAKGNKGRIGVTKEAAKTLGRKEGDTVRYVELISRKTKNHA